MVAVTMDGPGRNEVLRLIQRKDELEAEIRRLSAILETNGVGMHDSLVDENDFPRNDIDVYQVRNARHQIICLQNDHKALMNEIEKGLHHLHSQQRGSPESTPSESGPSTSTDNTSESRMNGHDPAAAAVCSVSNNAPIPKCIVKVNFVSAGSPAEDAGIKVDDEIIEFGSVNILNFKALTQIAEVVQHSVNSRISVKILRNADIINVSLIPHIWSGRGLLGCNIIPINDV